MAFPGSVAAAAAAATVFVGAGAGMEVSPCKTEKAGMRTWIIAGFALGLSTFFGLLGLRFVALLVRIVIVEGFARFTFGDDDEYMEVDAEVGADVDMSLRNGSEDDFICERRCFER